VIADNLFNLSLLIGPIRCAWVDDKTVMPGKIIKLGIEAKYRFSGDYYTLEVVITLGMGNTDYPQSIINEIDLLFLMA